jgi:hypothetical protein
MGASQGGRKRLMGSLVIRSGKTIKNKNNKYGQNRCDTMLEWKGH